MPTCQLYSIPVGSRDKTRPRLQTASPTLTAMVCSPLRMVLVTATVINTGRRVGSHISRNIIHSLSLSLPVDAQQRPLPPTRDPQVTDRTTTLPRPARNTASNTLVTTTNMTVATSPLTFTSLPPSPQADAKHFQDFGREVHGFDPANKDGVMDEVMEALYKVGSRRGRVQQQE